MTPYHATPDATFFVGDCRAVLGGLAQGSAHMVVCSPPYWSLRDYGIAPSVWGGSSECDHRWGDAFVVHDEREATVAGKSRTTDRFYGDESRRFNGNHQKHAAASYCELCGAMLCCLGLEPDPFCWAFTTGGNCGRCFLCHLRDVFAAVWRVLRDDGTLWCNLGDSYAGSGKGPTGHNGIGNHDVRQGFVGQSRKNKTDSPPGMKAKDLVLIPQLFALAMRVDGWYVRSQIVWAKKATMPESVTDRPTSAHETIWLLTKRSTYYYDADAVREPLVAGANGSSFLEGKTGLNGMGRNGTGEREDNPAGRNLRNVWHLGPEPFPLAHFAVFPTEIPRRAILAGTSERGACAECGAPYERVTEKEANGRKRSDLGGLGQEYRRESLGLATVQRGDAWQEGVKYNTLGWRPTCTHAAATVPAVVLDCFGGSGTTSVVARQLGRHSIYVDASETYAAMAVRRLEGVTPTLPTPSPRPSPATQLALGEGR